MNINDLEVPPPQQVQRVSVEATDKDVNFLSLRLLNKRCRVRLSPESLDLQPIPGKCQLFSVANSKGWFVAAVRNASSDISLIFSPLADLRAALSAATPDNAETVFAPKRSLSFAPATPNILAFASAETRLVVGLVQGPVLVFDTARLFSSGSDEIPPLHSFPSTSSSPPRQILPNPGEIPDLVAILRDDGGSTGTQLVEIIDVQKLESVGGWRSGNNPDAKPTSLSWSPKGKQIAVGLQSGDIITFNPTETGNPKFVYGKPPSASNQSIIATTWLSNPSIHTIYAPPGPLNPDSEQTHLILSLDSKHGKASDIKLNTPYYPSPGLRPPGSFMAVLRNWEPTKFIIFVGDSTSSDIGIIGSDAEDAWYNYSLEETSTPSLPLDKDMNDTILVALELDLTSTESYQHASGGDKVDLPAPPVMYAYASDGTVLGWYVVNSQGHAYPGMVRSQSLLSAPEIASAISSNDMQMSSASAPLTPVAPTNAFGQASSMQPAFGQSSLGSFGSSAPSTNVFGSSAASGFGSKPAFGQTAQPSGFGQSPAFGQASSTSPFTQSPATSPFSQPSSASPFGSATSSTGFGAFANASPAKFGQTGFGFGTAPTMASASPMPASNTTTEETMADGTPAFGGMSLGGSDDSSKKSTTPFGSGSNMFGQGNLTPASSAESKSSGFGSGFSAAKPATGFGAFSNLTSQPGAFGSGSKDTADVPKPASAFGKSGFDTKPASGFGQTGFAQPAFGQTGFGSASGSAFAKPATATAPSSGGFGSFASGPSSFSSAASQNKEGSKGTIPEGSAAKGFGAFAQGGLSAFSQAAPQSSSERPAWTSSGNAFATAPAKSPFSGGSAFDAPSSQKSAFASNSGNAFGQNAGFSTFGTVAKESERAGSPSSPPATPIAAVLASPASSPESSPQPHRPATSPFATTQNNNSPSSAFKATAPPPTAGAFGQLKASSTGFLKPAEGFGAFGGVINKESPFFNPPKEVGAKPVSVFGTLSTTPTSTPPKSSSTIPVFGSTSAVGANKSPFSSSTPVTSTPPTPVPTSGGFASFSNNGGFGAFSGAKTSSFSELLRGGEESRDPSKPAISVFGSPPKSVGDKVDAPSTPPIEGKDDPSPSKIVATEKVSDGTTSLASSQASSFVDVTAPDDDEGSVEGDEERAEGSGSELDDDNQSFLSENFSSEGSPDDDEEGDEGPEGTDDEAEGEEQEADLQGTNSNRSPPSKSQSRSRSPSMTPKPEKPTFSASPIFSTADIPPKPSGVESTTPPGSPESDIIGKPSTSTPATTTPPLLTLGLGRPSTRPARSSPLANAPLSPAADEVFTNAAASKSEPILVPKPAQPKTPFGMTVTPLQSPPIQPKASEEGAPKRTSTPPLLSMSSAPPTDKLFHAARPSSAPSSTIPKPTMSPGNVFNMPAKPPSPSPGFFSKPPTPPIAASSAGNLFSGLPAKPVTNPMPNMFGSIAPTNSPKTPNFFGSKAGPPPNQSIPVTTDVAGPSKSGPPVPPSTALVNETQGQGMQAQCALLFNHLTKELETLRMHAERAKATRVALSKPSGLSHHKNNLSDAANWTLGDVQTWGQVLKTLQTDIEVLHENKRTISQSLRELESSMLRAGTKKEEIVRFNKAKTDPEFGKMLKVRTLGPEHMETQSQLRRDIRTMRDRVQKLEDHLAASKKKLDQLKRGKTGLRPPSLDTINRTYRNIDIAVEVQADQIALITARMKKLKTSHIATRTTARDHRLPDPRRPYNTAPSVVVNAANALNGEVSAQRLKRALLSARQQPLLNTKAASAPAAPLAFATPQKSPGIKEEGSTPGLGFGFDSFPESPQPWNPASFDESPSQDLGPRRRMMGGSRHGPSPKLKKLPTSGPSPAGVTAPTFDWGPLPTVTPIKTLPFGFNKPTPPSK
ncbi:hypothetical protein HWV62_34989 [Athelia sp. TMB]|nr:hypothetical protein HWV62_34989 [Athelia sp. TMB]